jgi:hypothetical protein
MGGFAQAPWAEHVLFSMGGIGVGGSEHAPATRWRWCSMMGRACHRLVHLRSGALQAIGATQRHDPRPQFSTLFVLPR